MAEIQQANSNRIPPKVFGAIIATGLMSFCGVIIETSMNITFPTLMREFSITTSTVQWMTTIYLLIVAVIIPLSAILKESFTLKKLFGTAITLFICGVIVDMLAPKFGFLLLGRALQGCGTGIALPLMFNIILEQVPPAKTGVMMGFGNLITGIAPALGPTFGGIVVNSLGWRWIFVFLLPLLLIALILGLACIQQKTAVQFTKVDPVSFIAIVMLFAGLIYGFNSLSAYGLVSIQVLGSWLFGLVGLGLLVWRSLRIERPIINVRLFENLPFSGHVLGFFLLQMVSLGNAFLLPNYIQLVNGNSALTAGLLVLPAGVAGAVCAPFGGRILDRFGARKPILIGTACCLAANLLFAVLSLHLSNTVLVWIYILYMGGMGLNMGNIMTSALRSIPQSQSAHGNAILNTLQQFAGAAGTSITAAIVALSQKSRAAMAVSTAQGTQHAYWVLAVFCALIFLVFFKVVGRKDEPKKQA